MQNLPGATPDKGGMDVLAGNVLVLTFAALLVIIAVCAWAMFFRKPQRTVSVTPEEAAASLGRSGRRRRIKQRYPTLAETGGLPPLKS
ncbi:MAG: hypothetical protein ACK4UN_16450 [Limisphaerales bacterium]